MRADPVGCGPVHRAGAWHPVRHFPCTAAGQPGRACPRWTAGPGVSPADLRRRPAGQAADGNGPQPGGRSGYWYECGSYQADLPTDEHGLVLDYPGVWRRLTPAPLERETE